MTVATISGRTETHTIPIGTIIPWPHSSTAPAGWLMCDGSAVAISTYRALYNIITNTGTTFPFGANVGSTFLLPNLNGGGYMPRSPSTTSPPSGANSNVGATVAATTHTHTWDIGTTVNQNAADGSHNHNVTRTLTSATQNDHTAVATLVANTVNATATNFAGSGNLLTAFRAHGHNNNVQSTPHGHNLHNHAYSSGGNFNSVSHTHTWTTGGNAYTPTAINAYVSHLSSRYIILAITGG